MRELVLLDVPCARRLNAPASARAAGLSEWDASVHGALSGERRDAQRGRGEPAPPRAETGVLSILHTSRQTLVRQPDVHCVVPSGALAPDH